MKLTKKLLYQNTATHARDQNLVSQVTLQIKVMKDLVAEKITVDYTNNCNVRS